MTTNRPNEALASAIAKYPSLKAFSGDLGVPYQTVQQWMKNGVPAEYCPQIEKMTGGDALCEDLNSRVDWTYLRATPKPIKPRRAPRKTPTLPP